MAEQVCPVWIGYFLASPLRKLFQNPNRMLAPYLNRGKKVLDVGPGMGFFTLPMAEMIKPNGKVFCVDIQKKMLEKLESRANKKGLGDYIETIECTGESLNLDPLKNQIDFALVFAVLHEVPDQHSFLKQIFDTLIPGGIVLLSEPKGHVTEAAFEKSLDLATSIGFKPEACPSISRGLSVVMTKPLN
jgi:ubiquinone/menaquinone biosynthesis C-methylase UbiE